MKTLSKIAVIFPFIFIVAAAAIVASAAIPVTGTAYAEDTAFDVLYPESGYFPVDSAELVAAGSGHIAIYDSASHSVYALASDRTRASSLPLPEGEEVTGMWISSSALLVRVETRDATHYFASDLSSASPALTEVALGTPADISYIAADDDYFYAKSDTSVGIYSGSVAEGGLQFVRLIDDSYVSGKYIFTAHENKLYFYAQDYEKSKYFVYDIDEGVTNMQPDTAYIPSAVSFSDFGIVAAQKGGTVRIIKTDDGADVLCDTGISYEEGVDFAAYGTKLFVTRNGEVNVYTLSLQGGECTATLTETLAMRGDGEGFFDAPSDVIKTDAGTYVADGGNSRVAVYEEGTIGYVPLSSSPVALTADSLGIVYAATRDAVYVVSSKDGVYLADLRYSAPEGSRIVDITHTGSELFILTDSALYRAGIRTGFELAHVIDVKDGKAVAAASGSVVYVMTSTGVHTLSAAGASPTEVIPFRTYGLASATDIAADAAGTVFVSYSDGRIVALDNAPAALTERATFSLTHPLCTASPVAFTLSGSKALFVSSTCFVGEAEVGALDEDSYTPPPAPDTDAAREISFAVVNASTYLFDEPSRFDTVTPVAADTVALVYVGLSDRDGYTYVYLDGMTGYIESSALTPKEPTTVGTRYIAGADTALYTHPAGDAAVTLSSETLVTVTDDAAMLDDGAWRRVRYDGSVYFVRTSDLTVYVEPEPEIPEPERHFGRASAYRAGGLIGIYAMPDTSSALVTEAVDGTRMEIVGEDGDFWLVSFDDMLGYALKSEVELEGLTTVQIVSIVLCCAVAVTGLVVFVVIWQTRKKEKEKE